MDFTLRALGQTISGHLTVDDNVIHLEVALPWLLRLAAAPVLRKIEHGVLRLLSAPAPEAPPA